MGLSHRTATALLLIGSPCLWAQQYTISTYAGGGVPNDLPGTSISFSPQRVCVDKVGNLFILDLYAVYKLPPSGPATIVAGNGTAGFSGDGGPATSAQLNNPLGIALDAQGDLYISDTNNERVRKVGLTSGIITTVAGAGSFASNDPSAGDGGLATNANLNAPIGIAFDAAGNLFISDSGHFRVRKVSLNGIITTFVGTGSPGYSGDGGLAGAATIYTAFGLAIDGAGNLYLVDQDGSVLRKVTKASGIITTIAGSAGVGFSGDGGLATAAKLSAAQADVTVDAAANIYIADSGNHRVREIDAATGIISSAAGTSAGYGGDGGLATQAELNYPRGVAVDVSGNLYITDNLNHRVRKIDAVSKIITTVAGTGDASFGGDGGPAPKAQLSSPTFVAVDSAANLYIADYQNARIRKVNSAGVISTIAGGDSGFAADGGPATAGPVYANGVAVDAAGNSVFASGRSLRKITASTGAISTLVTVPPPASSILGFGGVALDANGNFYVADLDANQVLKISATGATTVIAGSGSAGFSGDGGPAVSATFRLGTGSQGGLALDQGRNLYIADSGNCRVRRVDAVTGTVTTIAGNSQLAPGGSYCGVWSGDGGPAVNAQLSYPVGIAVDEQGSVYVSTLDYRVERINASGTIRAIAGTGVCCFSGETGPATSVELSVPVGLAVDTEGNVFIGDSLVNRIRKLTLIPVVVGAVTNGASNLLGPVSPGEIVVLYGSGLGPAQLALYHTNSAGNVDTQLSGATVSFNGIPAPIIYTSATQVAAVTPYGVPSGSAQVTVTYLGQPAAPATINVTTSAPGLFTLDSTGKGQAAAVNQDGSINSASHPAPIGSYVSLFATGEGQTSPSGVDGKPGQVPLSHPLLPVTVTIGGQTVTPQYAGGAPGEVAGVMQVNVQILSGMQTGVAVPVVVQVGNVSSQAGVTIAISGK